MSMIKQNYSIREDQDIKLRKYCEKTKMKMSSVVQIALDMYFEKQEKKGGKSASNTR